MLDAQLRRARLVSSVAATAISLACGTNYVYSAWAPQFADKLHFSTTQSNLIGVAGNMGMYTMGVPIGMAIDSRGPRPAVIIGSVLLGLGYFPLKGAYDAGSGSVPLLCFFSYLTGLGGCMAFAAAVKTSALNWPHHRGTATAFPLAAFGLSAFFFSVFGQTFFPGDTGAFLLVLAAGTVGLTSVGFFFLRVLPHHGHGSAHGHGHSIHSHGHLPYQAIDTGGGSHLSDSQELRRTSVSSDHPEVKDRAARRRADPYAEIGTLQQQEQQHHYRHPHDYDGGLNKDGGEDVATETGGTITAGSPDVAAPACGEETARSSGSGSSRESSAKDGDIDLEAASASALQQQQRDRDGDRGDNGHDHDPAAADETSSLMSSRASTSSSLPGEILVQSSVDMDRSHRVDIRGWRLLRNADFWQLFSIMGILAGIGLMTINNIGHNANALWKHWDDSVTEEFLISRQQMHVSILSVGSFVGRLSSGVGSDFLVKSLHASRVWCLVVASLIFCAAQACAITLTDPHLLGLVSGLSGLGYGFLFGVFPSIVAESFGIHGLSQNWGFMTLSPIISGYVFNLFYGSAFDARSTVGPGGERSCPDGLECYRSAYYVTLGACGLGLVVTLAVIRHQRVQMLREVRGGAVAGD